MGKPQQLCFLLAVTIVLLGGSDGAGNNPLNFVNPNAQSSKGNEFVFAFFSNGGEAATPDPTVALFITTDEDEPVEFTVEAPNSATLFSGETGTARAGEMTLITLPTSRAAETDVEQDIRVFDEDRRDRGIRVKANDNHNITVYGLNDDDVSSDAFLALPCFSYSENEPREFIYFVFSANQVGGSLTTSSRFMLIPCEDDTTVTIIPSQALIISGDLRVGGGGDVTIGIPGRDSADISVDALQTYMFESPSDLTGTVLQSNKPMTVIVGHECAHVPEDMTACDVLVEQVPPHITWGRVFLTAPLQSRESGEYYRVGSVSGTAGGNQVTVTCTMEGTNTPRQVAQETLPTSDGRNWFEFFTNRDPNSDGITMDYTGRDFCCIESQYPITVMQYMPGHSVDEITASDPAMVYIPPVTQYLNDFTVTTAKQVRTTFQGYISYTIASQFFSNPDEDSDNVLFNGMAYNPDSGYNPIFCADSNICGYGAYSAVEQGDHQIEYDETGAGIFVNTYGLAFEISFEYPSGIELEPEGLPIFEIPDLTVQEDVGSVLIDIQKIGGDVGLRSIIVVSSRDGTAVAGDDYIAITPRPNTFPGHRLIYPAGSSTARSQDVLNVMIVDDDIGEPTETFEIYLTQIVQRAFVSKPIGTITILDNEGGMCVLTHAAGL